MKHCLLHPTDFSRASRAAFTKALQLAKASRTELVIAHVLAPVVYPVDGYVSPRAFDAMDAAARRHARKQLDALVRKVRETIEAPAAPAPGD